MYSIPSIAFTANPQPFTLFAPTDAAFQAVPNLAAITSDPAKLKAVLMYHLLQGYKISQLLSDGSSEPTQLKGQSISVFNQNVCCMVSFKR